MNILLAADYATPKSGNFIASCLELGNFIKQSGGNISFIYPEKPNTTSAESWTNWLRREGFDVQLVPEDMADEQVVDYLQQLARDKQIDILHIHFGLFQRVALRHADKLGMRILLHDHMDFAAGKSRFIGSMMNLARSAWYRCRGVAIISVNPHKDQSYRLARHWYVPNELSYRRNITESASREALRGEMGIKPDEKLCLFLGWDLHRKGLDIAIQAVRELNLQGEKVRLGIVGLGVNPSESARSFITDRTGASPESAYILYLPSREDMFAYHRASDVYLSASRSEAFSYGILEAISQNAPIAVSDIKGTGWCHDYSKTVVYRTEDYEDCARAIREALSGDRAALSNSSEITRKYDIDTWCKRIETIYRKLQ